MPNEMTVSPAAPPAEAISTSAPFELAWTFSYRAELPATLDQQSVNALFADIMRALAAEAQKDLPRAFAESLRKAKRVPDG